MEHIVINQEMVRSHFTMFIGLSVKNIAILLGYNQMEPKIQYSSAIWRFVPLNESNLKREHDDQQIPTGLSLSLSPLNKHIYIYVRMYVYDEGIYDISIYT